jgi:hypothetical protein
MFVMLGKGVEGEGWKKWNKMDNFTLLILQAKE